MEPRTLAGVAAVLAGALVLSQSIFVVHQNELAIRSELGKIIQYDYTPGIHLKLPFVNDIRRFDKRVLTRNYPAEQFLTSEGKILNVDFYVKWRITDVAQYYRATGGNEEAASARLAEIVKDGLKGVIAKRTIQQVVAAQRTEFIGDMLSFAGSSVKQLGVALVDVRVKRIDLPDDVSDSVFNRMRQDFARQAAQLRAEGQEQATRIRAEAERQRVEIIANAQSDAEKIRGEGDAKSAEIYARAYERNPEFYAFHRSLQAYRKSMGKEGDVLVVTPDSEFFKYMKQPGSGR
jgi:modulator of FtsH protease HflC